MNALTQYLTHLAQSKTGLSSGVLVGYAAQAVLAVITAVLGLVALFFALADWLGFGATTTSLGMFLVFVMLLIGSIVWTNGAKKRIVEHAQMALQGPKASPLLIPTLLTAGVRAARTVGWRRAFPAALIALNGSRRGCRRMPVLLERHLPRK